VTLLSKAAILAANDLPTKDIDVPEWGGTVRIRSMTATDRDAFEVAQLEAQREGRAAPDNIRARYVAACIVGEDGQPLFDESEVTKLGNKSAMALDRVFSAITGMNSIDAGAVEEAAKN
jgi:hypothetical protein